MRFSLTSIALAAASTVSGAVLGTSAALDTRAVTCSAGRRFTNFNNLPVILPASAISTGQVSTIDNYYDLNYTNFAAGNIGQGTSNNALYYSMSRIGAGTWNWWQSSMFGLIGINGNLPTTSYHPSIVGKNPNVNLRINSFAFGCGIQSTTGANTFVPFDCQVIIRPIETSRRSQSHVCTFTARQSGSLQTCTPSSLPIGRGFTFQTVGRVPNRSWFNQWRNSFNINAPSFILTGLDNLFYSEYCSFNV